VTFDIFATLFVDRVANDGNWPILLLLLLLSFI